MKKQNIGNVTSLVIFNVYGHRNCGDAALLEAFYDLLNRCDAQASISGVAFDPICQERWMPEVTWTERVGNSPDASLKGRLMQGMILAVALLISLHRIFMPLVKFFPERQREAVNRLNNARIAFSCPGGYLEDSNKAYLVNCVSLLLAVKLAQCVVLAPQSIGPVRGKLGRWFLRKSISSVDHIFVRESESLAFIQDLLGPKVDVRSRCSVSGDLAFWFSRKSLVTPNHERKLLAIANDTKILGLSIVDWRFVDSKDPEAARTKYMAAVAALIRHVLQRGSHQIVLFNQVSDDLPLAHQIGAQFPDIIVDTAERSSSTYLCLIGECDVFIGTRFHSCIFALLNGVPTTAIAYLPKTTGIMRDLGMMDSVIDINEVDGVSLISHFETMCVERQKMSELIIAKVERYREVHNSFLAYVATMADQNWNHKSEC
jgi:colanic acid/amylovoran biosynthesis protein